jgi:hypothetical protein
MYTKLTGVRKESMQSIRCTERLVLKQRLQTITEHSRVVSNPRKRSCNVPYNTSRQSNGKKLDTMSAYLPIVIYTLISLWSTNLTASAVKHLEL